MKLNDIDVVNRRLIFDEGIEVPVPLGERIISAGEIEMYPFALLLH